MQGDKKAKLFDVACINPESLDSRTLPSLRFWYIDISAVNNGVIDWSKVGEEEFSSAPSRARRIVRAGDSMLSTVRPQLLSHAFANWKEGEIRVCSTGFTVVRPHHPDDARLVSHLLLSDALIGQYAKFECGTGYPALNERDLPRFELPWPDIEERRRLTVILDLTDAAIELACEALRQVRRLRQAIVAAEIRKLGRTPIKLGTFISEVSYGTSQASNDRKRGIPTLRIPNVVGDGLDLSDLTYVDAPPKQIQRYGLANGDLLLVRTNGNPNYIGRSVVFSPPTDETWFYASYLIRVRLKDSLIPEYVDEYLGTEMGRRELFRRVTTSAGNYNINSRNIQSLPIPVPDEAAQKKIVQVARACSELVLAAKHRVSILQRIKRGLMQNLLTGKISAPANVEVARA